LVSPDGKSIYCNFYVLDSAKPWKTGILDAATGELVKVFDFFVTSTAAWAADSRSIIYSLRESGNLWRISLEANAKPQQVTNFRQRHNPNLCHFTRLQTVPHLTWHGNLRSGLAGKLLAGLAGLAHLTPIPPLTLLNR
jgi:hypothetical protein